MFRSSFHRSHNAAGTRLVAIVGALCALASGLANSTVLTPTDDDEVVELLPVVFGARGEVAGLRRAIAANRHDVASAVRLSRLYLTQARATGDPRFAGQAMAVLSPWPDPESAPDEILLLVATLQQHLHEFEPAASNLERLVLRQPGHAQAWLTLATVRRVQGRYGASDRACESVGAAGASFYAKACKAENDSLRGDSNDARRALMSLLAERNHTAEIRNWLLTTLAENEVRAGLAAAAESAYREALRLLPDPTTAISFADFLIGQRRYSDALVALAGQPRTDAVLLRLAIAGVAASMPGASNDVRELRERMDQANLRPGARSTHAREQAMFALRIDANARLALDLAKENVRHQREPLDLLVLAQAAAAANDAPAKRELASLVSEMGLRDARLDATR